MNSVNDLPKQSEVMFLLEKEAEFKKLKVFTFRDDELKKYHNPISDEVGVLLLAKNEDNAKLNLINLRRCYVVRLDN